MQPDPGIKIIDVVTIIALIGGPLLGAWYTRWSQDREGRRNLQKWVMNALVTHRNNIYADDRIKALALVDVAFHECKKVRDEWHEFYTLLNNAGLNDSNGNAIRDAKYMDIIIAMAHVLGYGRSITHGDLLRKYSPQGAFEIQTMDLQSRIEWLRILKNSETLGHLRRDQKDIQNSMLLLPKSGGNGDSP